MKIAIMQPYFFPYIGYFQLINAVDKFVIYDDVNYINRGWINRNQILINGTASKFSIPLLEASQNKKINEIKVSFEEKWKKKLIRSIEMSYKKAPFFEDVFPILNQCINSNETNLSKYILNSLNQVSDYLDLNTAFVPSSEVYNNVHLSGQKRIIDICKREGHNHYINPINGVALYDKELFEKESLKLNFIKTSDISYKQLSKDFIPYLSIIDVMMFNEKTTINSLLKKYELV